MYAYHPICTVKTPQDVLYKQSFPTYCFQLLVEHSHSGVGSLHGNTLLLFEGVALLSGQLLCVVDLHPVELLLLRH